MSVRVKRYSANGIEQPEWVENGDIRHGDVTIDNQTHHFAINEAKNFLDDGVGVAVAAGAQTGSNIVQDTIPFGDARS